MVKDLKKPKEKAPDITDIKIVKQRHVDRQSVIVFVATTKKLYQFRGLDTMSVLGAFTY